MTFLYAKNVYVFDWKFWKLLSLIDNLTFSFKQCDIDGKNNHLENIRKTALNGLNNGTLSINITLKFSFEENKSCKNNTMLYTINFWDFSQSLFKIITLFKFVIAKIFIFISFFFKTNNTLIYCNRWIIIVFKFMKIIYLSSFFIKIISWINKLIILIIFIQINI